MSLEVALQHRHFLARLGAELAEELGQVAHRLCVLPPVARVREVDRLDPAQDLAALLELPRRGGHREHLAGAVAHLLQAFGHLAERLGGLAERLGRRRFALRLAQQALRLLEALGRGLDLVGEVLQALLGRTGIDRALRRRLVAVVGVGHLLGVLERLEQFLLGLGVGLGQSFDGLATLRDLVLGLVPQAGLRSGGPRCFSFLAGLGVGQRLRRRQVQCAQQSHGSPSR